MKPIKIIPCLDLKDGRVVKGVNFVGLRDVGDPAEIAAKYCADGADEVVFLDISATAEGRATMLDVIKKAADAVNIPLTVGGGIRTTEDIAKVLAAGADKVSINSAAVYNPQLIKQAADMFGSDKIVVAIDVKLRADNSGYDVLTDGGAVNSGLDMVEWAVMAEGLGAGELLITCMDCDGVLDGYDIDMYRSVTGVVEIPVIASGGAGKLMHFKDVIINGGVSGVLAASMFHFGTVTVPQLKQYLKSQGIKVK